MRAEHVFVYTRAAGQKWGQVVFFLFFFSKKWCVQLRLDPLLDKITQGAATWCPLHRTVSPITPSISCSVSLFIWTALFLLLAVPPSQSCLQPPPFVYFFFYLSISLGFSCPPCWFRILWDGYLGSSVWQKRTVSSVYFFALPTPSCCKMQPGESSWDAIRDAAHIFDTNCIDYFISFYFCA